MKKERWPQVCLREVVRGILNKNPLKWGAEFMTTIREVRDGTIIDLIWVGNREIKLIEKFLKDGVKMKKHRGIQVDWVKTDRSTYKRIQHIKE